MNENYSFTENEWHGFSFNLCISAHHEGFNYIPGTATFIAPNLALTAKHVVVEIHEKFNNTQLKYPEHGKEKNIREKNVSVIPVQLLGKHQAAGLWAMKSAFLTPHTDVAYMLLVPVNDEARRYQWLFPEIDLMPPRIGDNITAYGFINMKGIVEEGVTKWSLNSALPTGVVRDVHYERRDSGLYNYPVVQTNARFAHGMSGGPVYNVEGRLFGVISGSLDAAGPEEEHVSYAAMI